MGAGEEAEDVDATGCEEACGFGGIAGDIVAAVGEDDDGGGLAGGDLLGDGLETGGEIGGVDVGGGGEGGLEGVGE